MAKSPAFQFYPGDARRDAELHMMSFQARGVWWEMLCCMWDAKERGKLEGTRDQLCRVLGCNISELDQTLTELSVTKTGDVTERNDLVTVINRRMFREERERKLTRSRVQRHREETLKRSCNDDVTSPSSTSSSSSLKEREEKKENSPSKSLGKNISDDEWLKTLEDNPTYRGLDVRAIYGKMVVWCETNGKRPTRRRFVNWLNREDKPLTPQKQERPRYVTI